MSRLAASTQGVAAVRDAALVIYDESGSESCVRELPRPGAAVARFGDEWLVLGDKLKHLVRVASDADAEPVPFAVGRGPIGTFGVGRDDTVAVARGDLLELWSRDDERRWSIKGGPFSQAIVTRDHVVAVDHEGALVFFSRDKGQAAGALRLASTDEPGTWRLADIDGRVVVLALGEWLVWIDAQIRKTVRRVRAKAKVVEMSADPEHVVVAVEGGFVQTFRAASGEPRGAVSMDDGVAAVALGVRSLFTIGAGDGDLHVAERQALEATPRVGQPVSALFARGRFSAVGDRGGRVRLFEARDSGDVHEVAAVTTGEPPVGLFVGKDGTQLVAAGARLLVRSTAPWESPKPVVLRAAPTAFATDEAYAFVGTAAGEVDVYDLESGRQVTTYALSSDDRITALLRLSGATLVVGTGALDGRVLVVDVVNAKIAHRISPHEEAFGVTCLAADARGRIVASGGDDCSVVLLDPAKGKLLARLRLPETPIAAAFEPTGRRLACVFGDGTAALVTLTQKGATVADLGLRGVTHVAWAAELLFGFKDGHVEGGRRHLRPAKTEKQQDGKTGRV